MLVQLQIRPALRSKMVVSLYFLKIPLCSCKTSSLAIFLVRYLTTSPRSRVSICYRNTSMILHPIKISASLCEAFVNSNDNQVILANLAIMDIDSLDKRKMAGERNTSLERPTFSQQRGTNTSVISL